MLSACAAAVLAARPSTTTHSLHARATLSEVGSGVGALSDDTSQQITDAFVGEGLLFHNAFKAVNLATESDDTSQQITDAFVGEGLLFHNAFKAVNLATDSGQRASEAFKVENDCGRSCSAWSLLRQDLPFAPYIPPVGQGQFGVGFVADVRSLQDTVVSMTPVDSNSVARDCFTLADGACKARGVPSFAQYTQPCTSSADTACRAYRASTCVDITSIQSLDSYVIDSLHRRSSAGHAPPAGSLRMPKRGSLSRLCAERCFRQTLPEAALAEAKALRGQHDPVCGVCFGEEPYWCQAAFPNVTSAAAWMDRYASGLENLRSDVNSSQCKFAPEQWSTFTETIKLLHRTRQALAQRLVSAPVAVGGTGGAKHTLLDTSSWNEVNLNLEDPQRPGEYSDALWESAILGVYYFDNFEGRGPGHGREKARALVLGYNQRNAPKQIHLYRLSSQTDDQIESWRNGTNITLSDYMQVVPL